ncbi:MAG: beta strand repeat-containing protein, partial [Luteolibacter sp.]
LKIDTNGFDLASNQPFMGSGGIIKSGEGVASFLGAHTYDGSNLIMAGQLILPNHATGTGDIQVDADASLGIREVVFNSQISPSNLTFAADSTLDFSFTDSGGLIQTNAPINVTGNLALGGNLIVNVSDVEFEIGSQPLIAYSSKSGDGVPVLGSLPENVSGTLEDSGSLVSFNITATSALAWDGDTDLWDLEATNWYDEQTSADDAAFTNDRWVNFDDLLTGTSDVVLNSLVSPAGTLFENNFFDFTLTGTGSIGGAGRLIKRGGALTSIDTANTYTGLTQIENGILSISAIADGGEASPIGQSSSAPENLVLAGGTLYYTGESASVDRSFITTATSGGIGTDNSLTITGSAKSTGGNFVKSGLGNLTLANNGINDFGGGAIDGVNVLAGTLTFDGSGGSQNNNVIGDIWVGTTSTSGANLVLADTAMSSADYLAIARGNGTTGLTSTVTLTNSTLTTGNLSLCYDNEVPGYNAAAVLTLNDSFYSVTGFNKIGESNGGNGTLVLDGSSTMSAGPTNIGQGFGAIGTLNIKGDSLYTTDGFNRIHVGSDAGSTGNLIIEGSGTMEVNSYVSVGFNGGGSMTVKENGSFSNNDDFSINESGDVPANVSLQDNGSITVAKVVYVGRNPDRVGTLTQTGGVFNGNGYEFQIGVFGTGSWLQSGGVTNASGWTSVGRHGGSTGVVTVSGGAFNQTGADRGLMIGEGGTGTLNIQESGTVNSMGSVGVLVGNSASGVGTINLDGGTLAAMNVRDGGGSSSFHFNGGVLMANTGANLNFMFSLDTADVKAGGAFIDSNDQTIAINQDLLDGTGGGGLTKVGAGFLQLNGNNTYTGVTTVSAGSLGGTGTIAGPLNVADTGTLAPGASVGSFTSGDATLAGTYAVEIDGTSSDQLIVNGDLDLDGANIEVMATAPIGSEWTIATYTGNLSGTVASVSEGYSIITSSPGLVKLVVTSDTPFSTWAATNISAMDSDADATADGDPDSDGLSNIVEFALNSNPLSGLSSGNIRGRVVSVDGSSTLVLTLPIRSGASFSGATAQVSDLIDGVIYSVEGSDQLITWDLVVSEVLGTDKTAIEADMPILENGWEYRTFQHPGVVATDPNGFLRAKITQP